MFCTIVLITGPIWARPVWGIWWTWDARLTTTLVLWLIYVSYLIVRRFASGGQTPTIAACWDLRLRRCADCVHVDSLVPYTASFAGDWWRRELGP